VAKKHKKLIRYLVFATIGMFAFSFALVPLYNVFCSVTGLNGKVDFERAATFVRYKNLDPEALKRSVMVEFDTNRNQKIPCEFIPEHHHLPVTPGELALTSYYVKNLTNRDMIIQAIPSISPGLAAKYLKKLECFCFERQALKPGESMKLPLRFWLEPEIPKDIHRLTLSYTLFDVTLFYDKDGL
jgi:cytochrome c oxidase assembly protein subunit 11